MLHNFLKAIKEKNSDGVLAILRLPLCPELNREYPAQMGFLEEEIAAIPLHLAIHGSDPKMVGILLEAGANVNYTSELGDTPLKVACNDLTEKNIDERIEIIKQLLLAGAKIVYKDHKERNNILEDIMGSIREAIASASQESYELLAPIAALLSRHNIYENFMRYVKADRVDYAREYLSSVFELTELFSGQVIAAQHVDSDYEGRHGLAILKAAALKTPKMLALFKEFGINLALSNKQSQNILHVAAQNNRLETIQWIFENVPNAHTMLNAKDTINGDTPLHLAANHGWYEAVAALVRQGANCDAPNALAETPRGLYHAFAQGALPPEYIEQAALPVQMTRKRKNPCE